MRQDRFECEMPFRLSVRIYLICFSFRQIFTRALHRGAPTGKIAGMARFLVFSAALALLTIPAVAQAPTQPPASAVSSPHDPDRLPTDKPLEPESSRALAIEMYRTIATREAKARNLPPEIADAVMKIESNYNSLARGRDGEYGLMQVMPPTAKLLGHTCATETLADPEINIKLGVRYLAEAYDLAGGDLCTTLMKYRAGHRETRFSVLSVRYCVAARQHLASRGFTPGGNVPEATFGFARDVTRMGSFLGTRQTALRLKTGKKLKSRANWSVYDARMKELTSRGNVRL